MHYRRWRSGNIPAPNSLETGKGELRRRASPRIFTAELRAFRRSPLGASKNGERQ
jgi:hypothetical protein